jgi:hypothetical protein
MDDRELVCSGLADTINPACSPLKWLVESPLRSSIPQTKSDATRRLEFVVSFWPKMTRILKYKRSDENNTLIPNYFGLTPLPEPSIQD